MMEKDKNKIDEIFKDGLNDVHFEFDESHWQNIESRLNQSNRLKKRKIVLLITLATTVAAVLIAFFIWNDQVLKSNDVLNEINEANILSEKEGLENGTIHREENLRHEPEQDLGGVAFQPHTGMNSGLAVPSENRILQDILLMQVADINLTRIQDGKQETTFTIPPIEYSHRRLPSFNLKEEPIEGIGERLAAIYQPKETIGAMRKEEERSVVSFLVGPDLTSVRGAGKSSLSENVGLAYSYPLAKGFHVSVGATYAKKNYKSAYKFYTPSNPPEMAQLPSNVSAVCDVLDVPLTASYTVLKSKNVKFNVSAGLSSYFMLKEKYTFDYEGGGSYSGSQNSAVYEVNGENQHIFGVADFSVSIEKKINDKINIGVKPFVKMPLTGIGYGNVDLESKGVAFTLGMSL